MQKYTANVAEEINQIAEDIPKLVACGLRDLQERENYFLSQEKWIRRRVDLLDEAQSLIIRERDLLKEQHDHCREQIANSRTTSDELREAEAKFRRQANVSPFLKRKEHLLDTALQTVSDSIEKLEESLKEVFTEKDQMAKRHQALKEAEQMKSTQTVELLKEVENLTKRQKYLDDDIINLHQQREGLSQWSDRLEKSETMLSVRTVALLNRHDLTTLLPTEKLHSLLSMQVMHAGSDVAIDHDETPEEIDL